ncbi:hypothetical protein BGX27_005091 [Mortierella sp. AM989]|nr:hypothetical protein BGX27_005091 [Mortierella sp. AM989]
MTKRGKQGGARGGRGGGRGGHSKPQSGRGGGMGGGRRGYGGGQYDNDLYGDYEDDYLPFTGGNHQHRQKSNEEEIYRRIQQAKAGRRGGRSDGGSPGSSANGFGGFRPPIPKQNGNGKNSKHQFWPHPDHINTRNSNGQSSTNNSQRGKPRNAPGQIIFQKASAISNPVAQDSDDDEDDSEGDSSDDLINRGIDSDDESDEEFLMQQFNWIEEDQDQLDEDSKVERTRTSQAKTNKKKGEIPGAADVIGISLGSLPISALDTAMTQSEDFMQAMEAEGDIEVHADEIENLSKHPSAIGATNSRSVVQVSERLISTEEVSETAQLSEKGLVLESQMELAVEVASTTGICSNQEQPAMENSTNPEATLAEEKPKKRAHRSKRGGKNQREKQMSKQMIVGDDDDGPMYLEDPSDEEDEDEDTSAMDDYLQNTNDPKSLHRLESLLVALKGLHTDGYGHSKSVGGVAPDDSDYEQQVSEVNSEDDFDDDDFDFEEDYEDGIKKLDFRNVSASMNDTRKNRKADDLLRNELQDLMPLWRSGALQDGDGANRRFKSRAKGYDLYDSEDGFMLPSSAGGKKKNKNKKEPHGGSFDTLMSINSQIENFVKDRTSDNLQLPPMPKALRRKVHLLCNHYSLKSQSTGSGKSRFPILIKTDRTKMPLNPVNVNKLLNQSEKELTKLSAQFQESRKGGKGGNGGGGKGKGKARGMGSGSSTAAIHGTVVGASASAISDDNLGHRMLSKMGWSPGVGLGANGGGITQPIEAIVRAKHRGLGHE